MSSEIGVKHEKAGTVNVPFTFTMDSRTNETLGVPVFIVSSENSVFYLVYKETPSVMPATLPLPTWRLAYQALKPILGFHLPDDGIQKEVSGFIDIP